MGEHRLERSPLHLFHRARQCADDIFVTRMKRGITPRQLTVLVTVAGDEGLNQTALMMRSGIDRSTTADLVRRLVKRGLLHRRRGRQDARAYVLTLTDEGRHVLGTAEPLARRVDARVLEALPKERRGAFLAALQAVIEALDAMPLRPTIPGD